MGDAKLPFWESPVGCASLALRLQPTAGLEKGMGPLPTKCLNLVPGFRVGGRASQHPSALEGPQSGKSPVTQSRGQAQGVSAAYTANLGQKSWKRTRVCFMRGGGPAAPPPLTRNPQSTGGCPQGSPSSVPAPSDMQEGKQCNNMPQHAMPSPQLLSRAVKCFDLGRRGAQTAPVCYAPCQSQLRGC